MIHSAIETVDTGQDPSSAARLLVQTEPVECRSRERERETHVAFNSGIRARSRAVAFDAEITELMSQHTEVN